jgi:hypothetical protein
MSADKPLRVDYTVTEEDVYRFLLYDLRHNRLLMGLLIIEAPMIFGLTTDLVYYDVSGAPLAAAAFCGLLAVAAALYLYRQLLWRRAKGAGRTKSTVGEHTVEISPDGLVATSATGEGRLKWTAFHRIVGTPDCLYLYLGKRIAVIIPRRGFSSLSDSERFLRAATDWHDVETSLPTI